ncbi:MAG: CDP-alcohol phosphatidyltransferase family protein [Candidatus Nanopelagicaceae bacterium]|nr:CDP-alcohol phosphatidyltransferase family protein [Candidatus Nanopelagicaceae bacterium]
MDFRDFASEWSLEHGGTSTAGVVGGWLRVSHRMAQGLSYARISPNSVTYFGVALAAGTAFYSPRWWIVFLLLFSLLCDGVDGSIAIVQNKVTTFGATLDSVADRISEALWAVAFYRLGAPLTWVVALWLIAALQEYARARLGSAGIRQIGVVTPAERPIRALILLIAILAAQLDSTANWLNEIAIAMTLLQAFSFGLVIRFARKSLN